MYDIFWVFCTPVMVSVAKSFDAPIKLLFKRAGDTGPQPFRCVQYTDHDGPTNLLFKHALATFARSLSGRAWTHCTQVDDTSKQLQNLDATVRFSVRHCRNCRALTALGQSVFEVSLVLSSSTVSFVPLPLPSACWAI